MKSRAVRVCAYLAFSLSALSVEKALSQVPAAGDPARPPSLKTIPVPEPANLDEFVKNRQAAIVLGKALFWGHAGRE
jgi:hypothetical protein